MSRRIKLELACGLTQESVAAFARLSELEFWLREMIYLELKTCYGEMWWQEVLQAFRHRGGIQVDRSFEADKRHAHMVTPETDPLWYVSFEVLLKILFAPKFWNRFKVYLTTKQLLRVKFTEITAIRNRVAHGRRLHALDLSRLESFMNDLDKGFWRFCTSYNSMYYSKDAEQLSKNANNGNYARSIQIQVTESKRPSAAKGIAIKKRVGRFFHVQVTGSNLDRYFDYSRILKWTKPRHKSILHIILDSFQHGLDLTIPAVLANDRITDIVKDFADACANSCSVVPLVPLRGDSKDGWKHYWSKMKPFELIAAEWPHYVIPPSHPFEFLDPGMPCKFFQTIPA